MLLESAAPKFLWSEAIAYACYLKNRVPTQVHGTFWKTPFKAFWGKKPDGENRSKLDSKTFTALFTGISDYQGKSWCYYKTGANRILHSRNITFARSHVVTEGAYDEADWGESVVPPAEGEEMTCSSSTVEQRDEHARTGGAQRVSSEPKKEAKPHTTHHAAVHRPSSTRSHLTMPSGPCIDTANSLRKLNAISSVNASSGIRTRRGNPNMPAISLDKERGGVKITVKDTTTTPDGQYDRYCDDSGSEDSDAYTHGIDAYIDGFDAYSPGNTFDGPGACQAYSGAIERGLSTVSEASSLYSNAPSLVPNSDTNSIASAPTVPSELAYQLATPEEARLPSYTATGELEGRFGELKLTSERFPLPAESALGSPEDVESHWALAARLSAPKDNPTVQEALSGPEQAIWWKSMVEEHTTLEKQGTFIKRDENGEPVRYKARLVAPGFSQQPGVDYNETFAPVLDVTSAFLHTDVEENLYMNQILYFNDGTNAVLHLNRSLYGLKQAGRMWNCQLHVSIIATHVDDSILITTPNTTNLALLELLRNFEMHDLGPIHHFLGIRFKRYKELGLNDAYPADTPMSPNVQLIRHEGTKPKFDYGMFIAQFTSCFGPAHVTAIKRVIRYLKGYSDADWGSNLLDRKSISGSVYLLGGAAVSWSAKKQATIALSTMEAEYMALSHACTQVLWFRQFFQELYYPANAPTLILSDNLAALTLSVESQFHGRSKHIDIRHHYMRDLK
ncbi:reverse transcriptase, partial [Rhizoctonia solani AG-3 Rhs1AP]